MLGFLALGLDVSSNRHDQHHGRNAHRRGRESGRGGRTSPVERGDTGVAGNSGSGFSSAGSSSATAGRGTTSFGVSVAPSVVSGTTAVVWRHTDSGQNSQPAIRTRLRAAIDLGPISRASVQQRAGDRFQQLSRPEFKAVRVKVDEGRGTLTGVVSSQRERRMSELLLRLEPVFGKLTTRSSPRRAQRWEQTYLGYYPLMGRHFFPGLPEASCGDHKRFVSFDLSTLNFFRRDSCSVCHLKNSVNFSDSS